MYFFSLFSNSLKIVCNEGDERKIMWYVKIIERLLTFTIKNPSFECTSMKQVVSALQRLSTEQSILKFEVIIAIM
jgi:hypothetical protein